MKLKRLLRVLAIGLAVVTLAACGQKSTETIIKNELKDSYTGYSENPGGTWLFRDGDSALTFNKKDNSITNSEGTSTYFSVISGEEIPPSTQHVVNSLASELKGTDNFTIIIGRKQNPTKKDAEGAYQIALSDGGKKIRIIEVDRDSRDFGYYDFSGTADE
ncbi:MULTISPECIES: LptM family lipoprotein [Streptococcus]|uniref:LptM family lipoprotein n=1 Tax=Streptococcus TaxID=1301 RepID=UPI0004D8FC75|nr:hypothetical protein [Streptococcus macedonicus]KEH51264.1 hypothetical protein FD61_11375 [Streptococcus macedonicus]